MDGDKLYSCDGIINPFCYQKHFASGSKSLQCHSSQAISRAESIRGPSSDVGAHSTVGANVMFSFFCFEED